MSRKTFHVICALLPVIVAVALAAAFWAWRVQIAKRQDRIALLLTEAGARLVYEPAIYSFDEPAPGSPPASDAGAVVFSSASTIDSTTASLLRDLPKLTMVSFKGPCPNADPAQILPHCIHVQWLHVDGLELTSEMIQAIVMHKQLTTLLITNAKLSDAAARPLQRLTGLEKVDLSWNPVSQDTIKHLANNRRLEHLCISFTDVTELPRGFAAAFPRLRILEALCTALADEDVAELAAIAGLEELSLGTTQITDQALLVLGNLSRLRRLDISGNAIRGSTLCSLFLLRTLEELNASNTVVTDEVLLGVPISKSLQSIRCGGTPLSDSGIVHLASMPHLSELYVGGTRLTDEGLKSLLDKRPLRRIRVVGTLVTDRSVEVLANSPTLKEVSLGDDRVSNAAVEQLRKMRPDLSIWHVGGTPTEPGAVNPFLEDLLREGDRTGEGVRESTDHDQQGVADERAVR